ncbi:MAG: CAAX prenyl protease-related protein [Nitrospirota bacterium]|jgi:CAAX prenyl protease-like protein
MESLQRMVRAPWFPYVAPFATFIGFTYAGGQWPGVAHLWYLAKTVVVGAMLWGFRRHYVELGWGKSAGNWAVGAIVGVIVLVVWVAPDRVLAPLRIGDGPGFDPYSFGLDTALTWAVIAVRVFGAAVVVPIMEELFWRSFLMRYLIDTDFKSVALGTFSTLSFAVVAAAFGFEHDRWVVGIAAGLAYGGLLVWRRDLFTCVLAHGVTNFGLGLYVLRTGEWSFW